MTNKNELIDMIKKINKINEIPCISKLLENFLNLKEENQRIFIEKIKNLINDNKGLILNFYNQKIELDKLFEDLLKIFLKSNESKKLNTKLKFNGGNDKECSICFEKIKDDNDISNDKCAGNGSESHNNMTKEKETHLFHKKCLNEWKKTGAKTCPLCRCKFEENEENEEKEEKEEKENDILDPIDPIDQVNPIDHSVLILQQNMQERYNRQLELVRQGQDQESQERQLAAERLERIQRRESVYNSFIIDTILLVLALIFLDSSIASAFNPENSRFKTVLSYIAKYVFIIIYGIAEFNNAVSFLRFISNKSMKKKSIKKKSIKKKSIKKKSIKKKSMKKKSMKKF